MNSSILLWALPKGRKDRIWRYGRQRSPEKGMGCYAVLAEDAAPRTVEKVVALCKETHVPFTKRLTAARLGQALGKAPRAAVVLLDKNFMK